MISLGFLELNQVSGGNCVCSWEKKHDHFNRDVGKACLGVFTLGLSCLCLPTENCGGSQDWRNVVGKDVNVPHVNACIVKCCNASYGERNLKYTFEGQQFDC